jgi:hypothetical protein
VRKEVSTKSRFAPASGLAARPTTRRQQWKEWRRSPSPIILYKKIILQCISR